MIFNALVKSLYCYEICCLLKPSRMRKNLGNDKFPPTTNHQSPTTFLCLLPHNRVINLKVRIDALDVVMIVERLVKLEHLCGLAAIELDGVLRDHRDFRRDRFDAFGLDRVEDGEKI